MTTVTTSLALDSVSRVFASPGTAVGAIAPAPIQRLIFTGSTTVPAKADVDESFLIITATLPARYLYRIALMSIFCTTSAKGAFSDWEDAMEVLITENQVSVYRFGMYNELMLYQGTVSPGGGEFKIDQNAVTNDFGTYFSPSAQARTSQLLIDASKGVSQLVIHWLDNSADTTVATGILARIEIDQFTPVQANAAPLNSSLLTYQ